jgi:hypothetical protein
MIRYADMPLKSGRLTRKELAFVDVMASTGDPTYAAKKAGYSSPQPAGSQNMANLAIQVAVKEREHAALITELLPKSTKMLGKALDGPVNGAAMKAVEIVFKRAYGEEAGGIGKAPSEMSPDELGAALDKLKRELSERATPIIEAEPIEQEDIPKEDIFE